MKNWKRTHPKGFWGSVMALVAILVVAIGGLWYWHTNQLATNKATQAIQTAQTKSKKLDTTVAKRWAKPGEYIKTSTTAKQLNDLKASGTDLVASVKPYRTKATAANRKRLAKLDAAQTKRVAALRQLQQARKATVAVNALVMPKALHNTKVDDTAMIVEKTDAAAITKAQTKVADANPTLKATLTKILTTCTAQVKERTALKAEIAKIATDGTLKESVTLAELQAFQTFLKNMTYPKLAEGDETLVAGVQKAIDAMDTKKIPLAELQRRAFFAYSEGKDMSAVYLDPGMSKFDGDTYVAEIWSYYLPSAGVSVHQMAQLKIARNGDYTMIGRFGNKQGNLFNDITQTQLDTMRKDITKGEEPKAKPLTEVFADGHAFYDWAIEQLDPPDPHEMEVHSNTAVVFIIPGDGDKRTSVDAVYDVEFNYGSGNPEVDAEVSHFGELVLAKDGTVYMGMPRGTIHVDDDLTAQVQQKRYRE